MILNQETKKAYDDSARMLLRGLVRVASEVNSSFWPMRSFVTNNPLHSLEHLDFEAAIDLGKEKLGGSGYLVNTLYRDYFDSGRILPETVDLALKSLAQDKKILLGGRELSHLEILRASLLNPLSPPKEASPAAFLNKAKDAPALEGLARKLEGIFKGKMISECIAETNEGDSDRLAHRQTLSSWCDLSLETGIVDQINREMVLWSGAFLDEGQAPWELPARKKGFYGAWKAAALEEWQGSGICNIREKISRLSERPEDAVLESLDLLGIPESAWGDYLSLHLAALPGWTAFSNWRARQTEYEWQQAHPIDLVQILAVRLWYEREWVSKACEEAFGEAKAKAKAYDAIREYMGSASAQHFLRKERRAARLPAWLSEEVDLLLYAGGGSRNKDWDQLAINYEKESLEDRERLFRLSAAWRLRKLAAGLKINPEVLEDLAADDLRTLLSWLDDFPESRHGYVWLEAFEASYRHALIKKLQPQSDPKPDRSSPSDTRPLAQAVFCIDVRSESFRRHLEGVGNYETYGFAGFFAAFIRYQAFGDHHENDLFPVVMEAKNVVHEIPRVTEEKHVSRHLAGAKLLHAGHTLFHDLKENVITPYVMVESIGWFFAFPFFGKTFWPVKYGRWVKSLLKRFAPPIATTMTVDKRTRSEVEAIIVSEHCVTVGQALREWLGRPVDDVPHNQIEALRDLALNHPLSKESSVAKIHQKALSLFKSEADASAFIEKLRNRYRITPGWSSARMEQVTRTGYTLKEQAFTVETALNVMGLTGNFAPFVLVCGHGSSNENNPFAAALDCGACGGNPGLPNARVFAAMANKPEVRDLLSKKGLVIPKDTLFVAAEHNTATDALTLSDLEDLSPSHLQALPNLRADLKKAAILNNQERCRSLPDLKTGFSPEDAVENVQERSSAWNQVRPEWGLSGNAAFIIGRRSLTKGVDLAGRVFLHSYNPDADPDGTKLEIIMTGPQVVAHWISMGYYFSMVDNEVYGSGNKIYHNVAGRIGIMSGPESDLQTGLPWQTVTKGNLPYHEPMRLLVLIEASRARVDLIISRHKILQHYYHKRWVNLVALDADRFYRYLPGGEWAHIT
ncbi:MAG: DUF2309 domain-containing protein [Nitrospiria bacterium]